MYFPAQATAQGVPCSWPSGERGAGGRCCRYTWEGLVQGRGRERWRQEGAGAPCYEPRAWAVRHGPSTGVVQRRQMLWGGQEGRTGPQEHRERRRCRAQLGGGGSSSSHMAVRGDGVENSCNGATKKEKKNRNIALKTLAVSQKNTDFFFLLHQSGICLTEQFPLEIKFFKHWITK